MGFSGQEYWSGLLFPPPGDLPNPGIEPPSPMSPALQVDSLLTESPGKPTKSFKNRFIHTWVKILDVYKEIVMLSFFLFSCKAISKSALCDLTEVATSR